MGAKISHLRPEVINDLKETTSFTQIELCDLYRQFLHDSGGNLTLSASAFQTMYTEMFPDGDAASFAQHVFRTFDKEKTGRINFKEFVTSLSIQLKGTTEQKLEWAFNLYDIHGDGYLTLDEVKEMIRVIRDLKVTKLNQTENIDPDELAVYIFNRSDVKHDGKISRQEFVQSATYSRTMRDVLEGATKAASSPFIARKERSGSFGLKPRSASSSFVERQRSKSRTGSNDSK